MAIWDDQFGGGEFIAGSLSGVIIIPSGQTTVITIPAPAAGKQIRLTQLGGQTTNITTGVNLIIGGRTVISTNRLTSISSVSVNAAGEFKVSGTGANYASVLGGKDEVFQLTFDGATNSAAVYSYEESV